MRRFKRGITLLIVVTFILQLLAPIQLQISYADEVDNGGFTIIHELKDNVGVYGNGPITKTFNEVVEAKIGYSTASTTGGFYNAEMHYVLPPGTTYQDITISGHVKSSSYNASTRTVTIQLADDVNQQKLSSGKSGEIIVRYRFNNPSPYPNGTTINLDESYVTWNEGALDGAFKSYLIQARTINYTLVDSWSITKGNDTTVTIVSDPTVNIIKVPYTIQLSGGNINLKDVIVTDTLPADATVFSSSLPFTQIGQEVEWSLSDLTAGQTTTINVTLDYVIDRDGDGTDEGVADGRTRINSVSVTGSPITTNSSNQQISTGTEQSFVQDTDISTTTFQRSTAIWGIYITPDETKYLPLNPSINTIDANYTIQLKNGDIALRDVVLVYQLPENVSAVVNAAGGVVDLVGKTITWNYESLNTTLHQWDVTLRYDIDRDGDANDNGVANGRFRDNVVSITGKAVDALGAAGPEYVFVPANSTARTNFLDMSVKWKAYKTSGTNNYTLPIISGDQDTSNITYNLSLKTTGGSLTDNIPVGSVTFIDDLPDYAEFVSYSLVGSTPAPTSVSTSTTPGAVLQFNFTGITGNVQPEINVVVKYNIDGNEDNNGVKIGTTQVNNFSVSGVKDRNDHPINVGTSDDDASKTITFIKANEPNPTISLNIASYVKKVNYISANYNQLVSSTYPGDKNYNIGDVIAYQLQFTHPSTNGIAANNTELIANNTEVTVAALPDQLEYTSIDLGQSASSIGYDFYYTTNNNALWQLQGSYNTNTWTIIPVADIVPEGEYLTGVKIVYKNNIPTAFSYSKKVQFIGSVKDTTLTQTDIGNSATLNYQFAEFGVAHTLQKTKSDNVWFRALDRTAWISELSKTDITNHAEYNTREAVDFKIHLQSNALLATDGLIGPTIIDIVPTAFDPDTLTWTNDTTWNALNPGITKPTMTVTKNTPSQGLTRITWSWPSNYELPEGEDITINYNLHFYSYAGVGVYTNKLYLTAHNAYLWGAGLSQENDTEDHDSDGVTTQRLIGVHETITVMETAATGSTIWVKGELDADYSRYPEVGMTTPGGLIDYKLDVSNDGNVTLDHIEIIEILPYENDYSVLAPNTARGSIWTPFLTKAVSTGEQIMVVDRFGVTSKATLTVEYSKAKNPQRLNSTGLSTIGTELPLWSTTPPEDLSLVRSMRIRITDFKELDDTPKTLEAGEVISFHITMRAPVGAPLATNPEEVNPNLQEAAWNSISMTAKQGGSPNYLLRNEPLKVGIIIASNPIGEIGDFVWFDKNGDGIQNDGYDDEYAGLNGITAILYNDENVEVDRTITGDDNQGKPGYYLFPNLETDSYYVVFETPSYYASTTAHQGNTATDSDGIFDEDESVIKTGMIAINTAGSDAVRIRHDIDLGLVDNTKIADLTVEKQAIGYQKADLTTVMFNPNKTPVNTGETILYKITVTNTGELPLNNVRVLDVMSNAGFTFTNGDWIDADGNKTVYDAFSKDANATLVHNDEVVFNRLEVGETYELYAKYVALAADENSTKIDNTVKVWANELVDQGDLNDPYAQDNESVDIASFKVDKTITGLKKSGTATFKAASNDVHVEVGDTIKYNLEVTNTGSIDLINLHVVDAKAGINTIIPQINIGASESVVAYYLVTAADKVTGSITNHVLVSQLDVREDEEDILVTEFVPEGLTITKDVFKINGAAPELYQGKYIAKVGDVITYKIVLTNTKTDPLSNPSITKDELTGSRNNGVIQQLLAEPVQMQETLEQDEAISYTKDYTVTQGDFDAVQTQKLHNVAFGKTDEIPERSDYVDVELIQLLFEKTADKSTYYYVGQGITYTLKVTNYSSIALEDVRVVDEILGIDQTIQSMAPGEVVTVTQNYAVKLSDISKGSITNTASVTSPITEELVDQVITRYSPPTSPEPPKKPELPPVPPVVPPAPPVPPVPPTNPQPEPIYEKEKGDTPVEPGKVVLKPTMEVDKVIISTPPTKGTVEIEPDGGIIYTPGEDFDGHDKIVIIVTTPDGETHEIEIDITDDMIPKGQVVLPATGGMNKNIFFIAGFIVLGVGLVIRKKYIHQGN